MILILIIGYNIIKINRLMNRASKYIVEFKKMNSFSLKKFNLIVTTYLVYVKINDNYIIYIILNKLFYNLIDDSFQ